MREHRCTVTAGVWAPGPGSPADSLLKQGPVNRVLAALAIEDAASRYRMLVDGLYSELR